MRLADPTQSDKKFSIRFILSKAYQLSLDDTGVSASAEVAFWSDTVAARFPPLPRPLPLVFFGCGGGVGAASSSSSSSSLTTDTDDSLPLPRPLPRPPRARPRLEDPRVVRGGGGGRIVVDILLSSKELIPSYGVV